MSTEKTTQEIKIQQRFKFPNLKIKSSTPEEI